MKAFPKKEGKSEPDPAVGGDVAVASMKALPIRKGNIRHRRSQVSQLLPQ